MTITQASTKSPYRVILNSKDNDFCILEVKRNGKYLVYEIDELGNAEMIGDSDAPYQMGKEERDENYYLDYLPGVVLNKINILTENPDLDKIYNGLNEFKQKISESDYDIRTFDMQQSYLLEDYNLWIGQMKEYTQDPEYQTKLSFLEKFFSEAFYERNKHLTEEEKENIIRVLDQELNWIQTHQIQ